MTDYNLFATSRDAEGALDSGISSSALSIVLGAGEGAEFPTTRNGSATSGGDATTLNSTGIQAEGVAIGDFIFNITDESHAFVISVSTNSITTTTLQGGTGNTWDNSDVWAVNMFITTFNVKDASGAITKHEDVLIQKRVTDTLTVETNGRAFNGTTAQSFDTGDNVSLFVDFKLQDNIRLAFAEMATDISLKADSSTVTALLNVRNWKNKVIVATTAAGTLASDFENGDTIDGIVLATDDRILIKDQAAGQENGIYTVNASGAPTRADDFDSSEEISSAVIPVEKGTANDDKLFQCTNDEPIIVDTTVLVFVDLLAGGVAAHASTHISGQTDEIDGDKLDIDFTPDNYIPDTSPSEVTLADELTAHLKGVDNLLARQAHFSTDFSSVTRDTTTNVGSGSNSRGINGLQLTSTATANSSSKVQVNLGQHANFSAFAGSPVFTNMVNIQNSLSLSGSQFFGVGAVTVSGTGHTFTVAHIGIKLIKSGGTITAYATQADGTTENAIAFAETFDDNDYVSMHVKVNGTTSVDCTISKNGGTPETVTLNSTNLPTSTTNILQMSTSNDNTASTSLIESGGMSYSR